MAVWLGCDMYGLKRVDPSYEGDSKRQELNVCNGCVGLLQGSVG